MKKYNTYKHYERVEDVHKGKRLDRPVFLGVYEASNVLDAVKRSAKAHGLPALIVSGSIVREG